MIEIGRSAGERISAVRRSSGGHALKQKRYWFGRLGRGLRRDGEGWGEAAYLLPILSNVATFGADHPKQSRLQLPPLDSPIQCTLVLPATNSTLSPNRSRPACPGTAPDRRMRFPEMGALHSIPHCSSSRSARSPRHGPTLAKSSHSIELSGSRPLGSRRTCLLRIRRSSKDEPCPGCWPPRDLSSPAPVPSRVRAAPSQFRELTSCSPMRLSLRRSKRRIAAGHPPTAPHAKAPSCLECRSRRPGCPPSCSRPRSQARRPTRC